MFSLKGKRAVVTGGSRGIGGACSELLAECGAEPQGLVDCDRPTTTKTRVVARNQQVVRVDEEVDADFTGDEVAQLLAAVLRAVQAADALILQDYNKGVLVPQVIRAAIDTAQAKGIPVVVDPKFRNFFEYRGCTIFKPNRRELESALGAAVDLDQPQALPAVLARLEAEHLLLTLSEQGMALISRDGSVARIPTAAREVYDVVGAGDTVSAYLAAMVAVKATPLEAAMIANLAAGVEVGKSGAATVSPPEVLEAYDAL
jgi:D-beta-D-heptose 7-phosphate kinase/D-beta-D-heptose 1-phosphate adenosyltransferase